MESKPSTIPSFSLDTPKLLAQWPIKLAFHNWLMTSAVIVTESAQLERFSYRRPSFLKLGATANYLWAATGEDWITKTKQLGFSTFLLLFSYWLATTHQYRRCVHISRNDKQNKFFLDTIKRIHKNTIESDVWGRPRLGYDNRYEFTFPQYGSEIIIAPPGVGVGRGEPLAFVHTSEVPWWDMADSRRQGVLEGLYDSRRPDAPFVNESTPNMKNDIHGRVHHGQEEWGAGFQRWEYDWRWKWTEEQAAAWLAKVGKRVFDREHGCKFSHPGETIYDEQYLRTTWEPEEPIEGAEYAYGVDCAEGLGGNHDASTITILRRHEHLIVQAYSAGSNRWGTRETARQLKVTCDRYDPSGENIRGYIERNNHGHAVIGHAQDMGVPGILSDPRDGRAGYNKTTPSKIESQGLFREALCDSQHLRLSCPMTVVDMGSLELLPTGAHGHIEGAHDDYYTAACLAVAAMLQAGIMFSSA